jgi:hypothetical protein
MNDEYLLKSGRILKVILDSDPQSPREDDNLGTMAAFHGRYSLGDKDIPFTSKDFGSFAEMEEHITNTLDAAAILPLYLYDHSGITMATTPFSCRWDSGQVGFIYITKAKLRKEHGVKRLNLELIEKAIASLESEVKTYNQYLTGDIYGFSVVERVTCDEDHEHENEIDACWGFYGSDPKTNGMMDHIDDEIDEVTLETA